MLLSNRREFLLDAGRISALFASAGLLNRTALADEPKAKPMSETPAANRLRVAILGAKGTTGRGFEHTKFIAGRNGCEVAVICDCDEAVVGPSMEAAEKQQGTRPRYEKDLRKVLEDPKIDIISIAMPNHWHALAAIWAMQAGKHVYVEKPVSHNVWEGRRIVDAARHFGKICQTGTQCRSMSSNIEAIEFMRSGRIGKITTAYGLCYKPRLSIGKVQGDGEVPATIDYDLWCGPGPKRSPRRQKLHYDWHWQWDFGNGDFGNQGIHQVDVARWGLGKNELPKTVRSLGGRFGYVDDGQTPNSMVTVMSWDDAKLIFEVRGLLTEDFLADSRGSATMDRRQQVRVGNVFFGKEGMVVCTSYTDAVAVSKDGEVLEVFKAKPSDDHFGNFAKAVRENNAKILTADIEEGHLSSALCHLGNISYRIGADVRFDELAGDRDLPKLLESEPMSIGSVKRMAKHLEKNGVALSEGKCRLGASLTVDPKTEKFVGNDEANQSLSREYRKGFEVPARF